MADERCVAFGPTHHFIVGAVLLACWRNAETSEERDAMLREDLADLMSRSECVPGGSVCPLGHMRGRRVYGHGICDRARQCAAAQRGLAGGAAYGLGAACRHRALGKPAVLQARCARGDSRGRFFNALGGPQLKAWEKTPACKSFAVNTVCMGEKCPYHPSFIIQEDIGRIDRLAARRY